MPQDYPLYESHLNLPMATHPMFPPICWMFRATPNAVELLLL